MFPDTTSSSYDLVERLKGRGVSLPTLPVVLPLLGVATSETAVFYGALEYALWGYLITLLLCILEPLRFENDASLLQALSIIPVFRLVNLGMPNFFDVTLYWLLLVYAPFLPAIYLLVKAQPTIELSFGWKRAFLVFPPAILVSAVLGILEYSILGPTPLVQEWAVNEFLLIGIVMFGFVAVVEEVIFRGIIQRAFENRLGRLSGLVITSVLFGLMHSGHGLPLEIVYGAFLGLLFGLIYDYGESLLLIILMHGTVDVVLFGVVPYQPWLVSYLASIFT